MGLVFSCLDKDACDGLGTELKGIASALYVAILTKRALFLQWQRHETDMKEIFGQPLIDWRLPSTFQGQCTESGIDVEHLEEVVAGSDRCFRVFSALFPKA